MSESIESLLQTCPCGTLIDVSEQDPFAYKHCPNCGEGMRVRCRFDHFEIQEVLGTGGMGAVYRALDINLNRMVALKLLRREFSANPQFVAQFKTEAALTASVNHPNVVKVYSCGDDHDLLYIAMELVDQGSLDEFMETKGALTEARALEVGIQIAHGLNAALQMGLIHRDIKPGNILFADGHSAKIVDFGLAALVEEVDTVAGEVWGTPYYVAPEKLDNQPEDARSDIYSLGATLFHAIAGRPPFNVETTSMSTLRKLKAEEVSLQAFVENISSTTAFLINKCLHNDPRQRYQSYEELIEHFGYAQRKLAAHAAAAKNQPVQEALRLQRHKEQMNWVSYGSAGAVVAIGLCIYAANPDAFSSKKTQDTQPTLPARSPNVLKNEFASARRLLFGHRFQEAARAFHKLGEMVDIPQPIHNWITLYEGLALLLDKKDARNCFERLEARTANASQNEEIETAKFFTLISRALLAERKSPADPSRGFDLNNHEAIAYLLLGVRAFNQEHLQKAEILLQRFNSAPFSAPDTWLGDGAERDLLKAIGAEYLADISVFRDADERLTDATTPPQIRDALQSAKVAVDKIKRGPHFKASLQRRISQLENRPELAAPKEVQPEVSDPKLFADAKQKRDVLCNQFRFSEAKALLAGVPVSGDKSRHLRDEWVQHTEGLAKFKLQLTQDLNKSGFPQPITRRGGIPVQGTVSKADERQIYVRTQYGFVPLVWSDVAPESLSSMAQYFLRQISTPEALADRRWFLGNFHLMNGHPNEAKALLTEASLGKAEYRTALADLEDLFPPRPMPQGPPTPTNSDPKGVPE